jgi:general secretion pathway protein K
MRTAPPTRERGFILVLTLWIIALFGLGIAAINTWLTTAVDNARVLKERTEAQLTLMNAKNEIVYAMATRPMTYRGLETGADLKRPDPTDIMGVMSADYQSKGFVAFDGRPYVLASNTDYAIELQDGRGLINLNFATPQLIHRLLSLYDIPETLRNQLPDTLADWIDEDDYTRLSGAEKSDYERRNRLPPSNAPLLTPMEVENVLGWDEVPQLWQADLRSPLFTTCKVSGFNPNTAPEVSLLTYVPGMTADVAAATVQHRRQSPFQHARAFMEDTGVVVPNEAFFFGVTPGNCVVIDLVNRVTNERTRMSLSLMPMSQNQPWQVDYAFTVPTQYRKPLDGLDPANSFPTPEALAPVQPGSERALGQR